MTSSPADPTVIIRELNAQGKDSRDIAIELVNRGIRPRQGRSWSEDMVARILRLLGEAPVRALAMVRQATGARAHDASTIASGKAREKGQPKFKKWKANSKFTDAQKAEIMRLYQHEHMSSGEIAKKLGLQVVRVNPFCASLAGFSVPPGEIVEFIDELGRKVMKCPPGYARGAYPQRNVGSKGGA